MSSARNVLCGDSSLISENDISLARPTFPPGPGEPELIGRPNSLGSAGNAAMASLAAHLHARCQSASCRARAGQRGDERDGPGRAAGKHGAGKR